MPHGSCRHPRRPTVSIRVLRALFARVFGLEQIFTGRGAPFVHFSSRRILQCFKTCDEALRPEVVRRRKRQAWTGLHATALWVCIYPLQEPLVQD